MNVKDIAKPTAIIAARAVAKVGVLHIAWIVVWDIVKEAARAVVLLVARQLVKLANYILI